MQVTAVVLLQVASLHSSAAFESARVHESSGVAVSRAYPGVLWTHNDSGDGPYLYATDLQGHDRGRLLIPGAKAMDWEDMALGPCPVISTQTRRRSCLYLADTGDNGETRSFVTVYAVPEPIPSQDPGDTLRTTSAPAILKLRYPDGAHDVEAIYIAPRDTALFLVSKGRSGAIRVYRMDRAAWRDAATAADIAVATKVQSLDIHPNLEDGRVVTGAAVRRDGRVVALRTYSELYFFFPGVGGRLTPARERPCSLARLETGGEAVAFVDDSTLVLTTEADRRHPGRIQTISCMP